MSHLNIFFFIILSFISFNLNAETAAPEKEKLSNYNQSALKVKEAVIELQKYIKTAEIKLNGNKEKITKNIDLAKNSSAIIDDTIAGLQEITNRFDSNGDLRTQIKELENYANKRGEELSSKSSAVLTKIAPRFFELAETFRKQQLSLEDVVKEANTTIRSLKETKEATVALIQLGALQDAKILIDKNLKEFTGVLNESKKLATDVEDSSGSFTSF